MSPAWIAMAARAFAFIATEMTRGDRLGHSWREGGCCSRASPPTSPHDQSRARAARSDRRAQLPRPGARLAARARPLLRQSRQRRLLPHRRRRRGPGGAPGIDHRRRDAQPERGWRHKTSSASRRHRRRHLAQKADRLIDGVLCRGRRKSFRPRSASQRARPAPARGRDRGDGFHRASRYADRRRTAATALHPHRAARVDLLPLIVCSPTHEPSRRERAGETVTCLRSTRGNGGDTAQCLYFAWQTLLAQRPCPRPPQTHCCPSSTRYRPPLPRNCVGYRLRRS